MKLKRIYSRLNNFGLDPLKIFYSLAGIPFYIAGYIHLVVKKGKSQEKFKFGLFFPCLWDRYMESGKSSGHYFYQDLHVAGRILENNPGRHMDLGSRVDGFVAHVASFRPVEVIDIRPLPNKIKNVSFVQMDIMSEISPDFIECCDSLSCLHALEHFGLGRYGDPINFEGHLRGFENISRILKPSGKLYFSVPIGPQRVEFNAHRVFSIKYLLNMLENKFRIDRFSFVNDAGFLEEDITLNKELIDSNCGCFYGCGIFELTKL
jgi:SAM-dependent methyltransferase